MDKDAITNNQTPTMDKNVHTLHVKPTIQTRVSLIPTINIDQMKSRDELSKRKWWIKFHRSTILHYITLVILVLAIWGWLWCAFGGEWRWNGKWFRIGIVAIIAWGSGLVLQQVTTLPPLLAALTTGILARHFGFLDMRNHVEIDLFLRKIYPVIILGKGSLTWDLNYIRKHWRQVVLLGGAPWIMEVAVLAICAHTLIGFPWIWGVLLGSVYASVSCPVIMPLVQKHSKLADSSVNWPQLICTAGGLDTALSVGVFGAIFTFIFFEAHETYRYAKLGLALFAGVALGVCWGSLAKFVPHSEDTYVTELRVLYVLVGGLLVNFFTSAIGWGGSGAVAVLACNATASNQWAKKGWKLNQNPAATAYRVIWTTLEPILFAFTGSYFVVQSAIADTMLIGLGILTVSLSVRLLVALLMCWNLRLKQKLFVCCTWIPKSIVEAVLCPLAINALYMSRGSQDARELVYAEQLHRLIVQAIFITTPIGYFLTDHLGPTLLSNKQQDCENSGEFKKRKSTDVPVKEFARL